MAAPSLLCRLDAPFLDELTLAALGSRTSRASLTSVSSSSSSSSFREPRQDDDAEAVEDDELIDEEQAAESNRYLAHAEAALDELDEAHAMSSLRQALRLDPTNERVATLLAELCYTGSAPRPRAQEVAEALEEAAFFQRNRLPVEARETLREALAQAPGDPRLLAKLHRLGVNAAGGRAKR